MSDDGLILDIPLERSGARQSDERVRPLTRRNVEPDDRAVGKLHREHRLLVGSTDEPVETSAVSFRAFDVPPATPPQSRLAYSGAPKSPSQRVRSGSIGSSPSRLVLQPELGGVVALLLVAGGMNGQNAPRL